MEISESRVNNRHAIASVEKWLSLRNGTLSKYYQELIDDKDLLQSISQMIDENMNYKANVPGLFNFQGLVYKKENS